MVSWSTILLGSLESTTRSGCLAAIASAFGLKPDRSRLRRVGRVVRRLVDGGHLRAGADGEEHLGRGRRQRDDLRRLLVQRDRAHGDREGAAPGCAGGGGRRSDVARRTRRGPARPPPGRDEQPGNTSGHRSSCRSRSWCFADRGRWRPRLRGALPRERVFATDPQATWLVPTRGPATGARRGGITVAGQRRIHTGFAAGRSGATVAHDQRRSSGRAGRGGPVGGLRDPTRSHVRWVSSRCSAC